MNVMHVDVHVLLKALVRLKDDETANVIKYIATGVSKSGRGKLGVPTLVVLA